MAPAARRAGWRLRRAGATATATRRPVDVCGAACLAAPDLPIGVRVSTPDRSILSREDFIGRWVSDRSVSACSRWLRLTFTVMCIACDPRRAY